MLMKPNYTKAKSPNDSLVDESFAYYATRKVAITFGFEKGYNGVHWILPLTPTNVSDYCWLFLIFRHHII